MQHSRHSPQVRIFATMAALDCRLTFNPRPDLVFGHRGFALYLDKVAYLMDNTAKYSDLIRDHRLFIHPGRPL
jgi:hypothetical protein